MNILNKKKIIGCLILTPVLYAISSAQCTQLMQLPDDTFVYIGTLLFTQSAPNIILTDPLNEDEKNIAEIHKKYTVLTTINNDFKALKSTNKRLYCILHNLLNYPDLMAQAQCTVVSADIFLKYYLNNIKKNEDNYVLLSTFNVTYPVPFKRDFLAKLFGWKPTFSENVQGNCILYKGLQEEIYLEINLLISNEEGLSFAQKKLDKGNAKNNIPFLSELVEKKECIIEILYPYMESLDTMDKNAKDFANQSNLYPSYRLNRKPFLGSIEIKKTYHLEQKYTIPISKIPLSMFIKLIKKK